MVVRRPRSGRSLTLRTIDPDGRPVPGVRITLWRSGLQGHPSGVSDAAGLVRFDDLVELEHTVTAQVDATDDSRVDLADAPATHAIPDAQTLDVTLRRARPVRGMVVTADGSPVAGCTVNVDVGPGRPSPYVFTRPDGTFVARIAADETGPFDLRATSFADATPQWAGDAKSVAAGAQDVRIVIAAPKR